MPAILHRLLLLAPALLQLTSAFAILPVMARTTPPETPLTTDYLSITLSPIENAPLTIRAHVTNTHPTLPFSILPWDSPLDSSAFYRGVFTVNDTTTTPSTTLEFPRVQLRRRVPQSTDILVEVPANGGEVVYDTVLERNNAGLPNPIEAGKTYSIAAKGKWWAVWASAKADVPLAELQKQQFGEGALVGEFESPPLVVTAAAP